MRPIHPEGSRCAARGVTLIELVVVMVVIGIAVAATVFFVAPLSQGTDLVTRAELTDIADNTLQRIGRDVHLALPNSVRVSSAAGLVYLEFLAVRAAGRYRADGGGAATGTVCNNDDVSLLPARDNDQLSFDLAPGDRCFKSVGKLPNANTIVVGAAAGDFLVLNNYGPGFTGQNAYEAAATNRVRLLSVDTVSEVGRDRFGFAATTFQRSLHDSAGKRFHVVSGPVSYVCDPAPPGAGTITRYSGYAIAAVQPLPPTLATNVALIAENVSGCNFDYSANVAPQIGLLSMRVQLAKARAAGTTETVSLYEAVHVSNVP